MLKAPPTLFTIGHSTRTLEVFTAILKAQGVAVLADVRTVPRSRRVPQFNAETLGGDLAQSGNRIHTAPGTRRVAKGQVGLRQYGLAKR